MASLTSFLKLYKPAANEIGWDDNMNANLDVLDNFINQFMHIPNFVGTWTNSTAYAIGQITLDTTTGQLFRCAVSNTSSAAPTTFPQERTAHPTFWTLTTSPAQDSATAAANSATAAASSASQSAAQFSLFRNTYYGSFSSDPVADPSGAVRTEGDLYFNTTSHVMRVFTALPAPAHWIDVAVGFADTPVTPAGTAYLRTDLHTWVQGVPSSGGVFSGNVQIPTLSVGRAKPPDITPTTLHAEHVYSIGALTLNLYFSPLPAPNGSWRYFNAVEGVGGTTPSAGAAVFVSGVDNNAGVGPKRLTTLFTTPTGEVGTANGIANLQALMQWRSGTATVPNEVFAFGSAFKPGGGVWADSSDLRIKNIVGPYPRGLTELLEMLPKMFTYKGNDYTTDPATGLPTVPLHPDTTTQHVGLIAQDCEPYMPELVTTTSAYVDGVLVNDLRQVDATGVIYALVNAVAELDARLKALEPP